jgi:DNA-binding PadR family transcriptional regulator
MMLTELDNCILAVIWRGGPMSAYGVRAHFGGSVTATWSSSTGTVYPAIRRLRETGLLEAGPPTGPRKSELLTLTSKGREALDEWLTDVRPELGLSTADPIRTRVHFLAALEPAERRKVLGEYRRVTCAAVERLQAALARPLEDAVDRSEQLGRLGALAELKARLEFLDMAERELSGPQCSAPGSLR